MLQDELVRAALEAGADKAAVIDISKVVLSETFRQTCEGNQCGNYGRNWSCPPYTDGDIQKLMAEVKSYRFCLLYQIIGQLEDSFDVEGMMEAGVRLCELGQKLSEKLPELLSLPYLQLSGSCRLCEKCARLSGEPCRFPEKTIRSISGYGIDVYNTTSSTDLKYINGQDTVTNFGIVLFSE
ncbi:MAG: DUF2284 domain-containing protein [Eubacteriales bacterium]|nr:DUF2284 domain-containing protein [Eubacteriales bacterium]